MLAATNYFFTSNDGKFCALSRGIKIKIFGCKIMEI
jgi:hypothetical protein